MDFNQTCLAVINLDSALKKDEVFLEKCKYIKKKLIGNIDDLESCSDDSDEQ